MSEKFWDKMAKRYSKQPVGNQDAYETKLEVTQKYLTSDTQILEFGCGTGSTAIIHAPFVKNILAIDISSKMIEIAQEKAEAKGIENIEFRKSDFEELEIIDNSVDIVMGHSILHLVKDPNEVISKSYQKLKKGGFFITSTACIGNSIRFRIVAGIMSILAYTGWLPLIQSFSGNELLAMMEQTGFEIEHQWQPTKNSSLFIVAKKV